MRHRTLSLTLAALWLSACASRGPQAPSTCYHGNAKVEEEIGYCQAVRTGNTLHISGTVGDGEMPAAIRKAYGEAPLPPARSSLNPRSPSRDSPPQKGCAIPQLQEVHMKIESRRFALSLVLSLLAFAAAVPGRGQEERRTVHRQVIVPGEDRFTPLAQTIHVNDIVTWINNDTDDHTVVSDDFVNTNGQPRLNVVLKGTDNNDGKPGVLSLRFTAPGTFVYYCRLHAHLDADHQPAAPGPKGGIEDADGNHGTPMMGVVTVLPNP